MTDEAIISQIEQALTMVIDQAGVAENTGIVPNLEVIDAAPTDPALANYIIVRNAQNFYVPVLKLPGFTYTNGDFVNVLYIKGTEPVAMQQGSGSPSPNPGGRISTVYDATLTNPVIDADAGGIVTYAAGAQATEGRPGAAEIATQAEVTTGTDDVRYITPLKLATRLASGDVTKVSEVWESDFGAVALKADASGKIGIGTSTPGSILHTVGNATNAPIWTNYGYGSSPTVLGVQSNGTEATPTATANGDNIWLWAGYGYETTTPSARLAAEIRFVADTPSGSNIPAAIVLRTHDGSLSAGSTSEKMRLTPGGRLLVGGTTAQGGTSKLELHSSSDFQSVLYNSGDTTADRGAYIDWYTTGGQGARIGAFRNSGDSDGMSMIFATEAVGGSLTARMYITNAGLIGIGGAATSAPGIYLDPSPSATNQPKIIFSNASGALDQLIDYVVGSSSTAFTRIYRSTNTSGAKYWEWYKGDNTKTPHARIGVDTSVSFLGVGGGSVGIGTTTPTLPSSIFGLHVKQASANTAIFVDGGTGQNAIIYWGLNGTAAWHIGLSSTAFTIVETGVAVRATFTTTGGMQLGAPTGGDKGAGTLNVSGNVYKNNTAYTNPDYALEYWATGAIERYKDRPGAVGYERLSLDEIERYIRQNFRLPRITDEPTGIFDMADIALEKIEELYTYVIELHQRVRELEGRHGNA